jgi:uncharacterized protein (AIM24 family)
VIYNYHNLPENDNLNRFSYGINVKKQLFIQKGKMIAYYGALKFEALGRDFLDVLVQESFNAPLYLDDFVLVSGMGKLILGDQSRDIASYALEDAHLTVKRDRVLGFESTLVCQQSTFYNYLTFLGTGQLIASSNGPVHFLEAPARVDPEAILGWADLPSPSYYYDYEYVNSILSSVGSLAGVTFSGEEKQLNFAGKGTILIQSSER